MPNGVTALLMILLLTLTTTTGSTPILWWLFSGSHSNWDHEICIKSIFESIFKKYLEDTVSIFKIFLWSPYGIGHNITFLQSPAIAIAIAKTVMFCLCHLFSFFPSTDFSTSLGRFSQNLATRRGMSWDSLSPIGCWYVSPTNLRCEKNWGAK